MRLSAFILILQSATLGALYLLVHGTLSKSLNLRLSMKLKMASMDKTGVRRFNDNDNDGDSFIFEHGLDG